MINEKCHIFILALPTIYILIVLHWKSLTQKYSILILDRTTAWIFLVWTPHWRKYCWTKLNVFSEFLIVNKMSKCTTTKLYYFWFRKIFMKEIVQHFKDENLMFKIILNFCHRVLLQFEFNRRRRRLWSRLQWFWRKSDGRCLWLSDWKKNYWKDRIVLFTHIQIYIENLIIKV